MTINEKIKKLRTLLQLNQADFAKKLDVGQTTICDWERLGYKVSLRNLAAISERFSVNMAWWESDAVPIFYQQIDVLGYSDTLDPEKNPYIKVKVLDTGAIEEWGQLTVERSLRIEDGTFEIWWQKRQVPQLTSLEGNIFKVPIIDHWPEGCRDMGSEATGEYFVMGDVPKEARGVLIKDDSMSPRLKPGDCVAFLPNSAYAPGDIIVATDNFGALLVRFFRTKADESWLIAENNEYAPLQAINVTVIGKVIKAVREIPL